MRIKQLSKSVYVKTRYADTNCQQALTVPIALEQLQCARHFSNSFISAVKLWLSLEKDNILNKTILNLWLFLVSTLIAFLSK